ncbi:site-2 protease family protein [Candidatus Woesearchaeota archaeon]|nr:site-2 protease family protein [Candidatus Woesearchaeota archaeon]
MVNLTSSHKIARVFGIDIKLHMSWFFIFFLLAWSLATWYFPTNYEFGTAVNWVLGYVAAVLLFVSVAMHELAHSLVGRRHGIKVYSITLFFFGGIANISDQKITPDTELKVSLAGPFLSLTLSALFFMLTKTPLIPQVIAVFDYLFKLNLILALFNLAPGYPLDGGRVLRAIIWKATGDIKKATKYASEGGKTIGYILVAIGVIGIFFGYGGLWYILLGLFLVFLAGAGFQQVLLKQKLSMVNIKAHLEKKFLLLSPKKTLTDFVKKCIELDHHSFIVKNKNVYGVINLDELSQIPKKFWPKVKIGEVAKVVTPLSYDENAYNALRKMQNLEVDILPVEKGNQIVGVLHESALMNLARIRLLEEKLEG